jgi:hypothetical protein
MLAAPLLAAACAQPEPQTHASAVDRAACRQRAEEVYQMQNRGEEYRSDLYVTSTRDAPFAGSGVGDLPNRGLDSLYARQQMVSDCLNSTAGNVGTTRAAPAPDATPPAQ